MGRIPSPVHISETPPSAAAICGGMVDVRPTAQRAPGTPLGPSEI